ncbi:aldo/keto reductase [Alicyclobacillus sp. ALC3]|uniref:aldo/keto reductase n=1 Tax=Alicyclobacillus sp. ALC3 TaxID=2796143 RepID=UPI0023795E07|nr:aldo/keto reductase [Alicyclobacillus sp. ALC3]WDL95755.1 aldo/keto reductase [Alicyclobacillus sp. ALC3]
MKYRKLGGSGLDVSVIGLGTNAFGRRADRESSIRVIHAALDAGVNFIDTANIYTGTLSESIIGEAIADRRDEVVLATKAGLVAGETPNSRGSSRAHLMREVENSLKRLRTDYIDLYQIHTFDPYTPLDETLRALDDLVRSGKVRYIGASNYLAWVLMKALAISDARGYARYVSIQPSYSLADRTPELELTSLCGDQGIGLIPYFPLAGGILTGKYAKGAAPAGSRAEKEPRFASRLEQKYLTLAEEVGEVAQKLECTSVALSLAWLVHQPTVATVIVGATKPEQVAQNVTAAELALDAEVLGRLDEVSSIFKYGPPFSWASLPAQPQ